MKRVDYWTERNAWPFVKPGYLFLPDAFDRIGAKMFGADWAGEEGSFIPCGEAPPSPKFVFEKIGNAAPGIPAFKIGNAALYNKHERRIGDHDHRARSAFFAKGANGMNTIKRRLAELEARKPAVTSSCHRMIVQLGSSVEDAINAYGRERIGPADRLIVRTIVDAPDMPRSPARLEIVR